VGGPLGIEIVWAIAMLTTMPLSPSDFLKNAGAYTKVENPTSLGQLVLNLVAPGDKYVSSHFTRKPSWPNLVSF